MWICINNLNQVIWLADSDAAQNDKYMFGPRKILYRISETFQQNTNNHKNCKETKYSWLLLSQTLITQTAA